MIFFDVKLKKINIKTTESNISMMLTDV